MSIILGLDHHYACLELEHTHRDSESFVLYIMCFPSFCINKEKSMKNAQIALIFHQGVSPKHLCYCHHVGSAGCHNSYNFW